MKTMNIFLGTIEGVKNFVNTVCKLDCDVDIASGRYVIDAKSIMGILVSIYQNLLWFEFMQTEKMQKKRWLFYNRLQ